MDQATEKTSLLANKGVSNNESHDRVDSATRKLWIATLLCATFMTIEVIGGYIAGSLAVMTDAAHLLTDVAGFLISIFALTVSKMAPTENLSFGFGRAEILGALCSVAIIWILTGILLYQAFVRADLILTHNEKTPVNGKIMFIVAVIGIFFNLVLLWFFQDHPHGHSHGFTSSKPKDVEKGYTEEDDHEHGHSHESHDHGHSHEKKKAKKKKKKNHGHSHEEEHGHSHDKHGHSHEEDHGHRHEEEHGHSHEEDHGHSHEAHGHDMKKGKTESLNISAAYAHAIGDLMQSCGVALAGALIWIYPYETYPTMQLCDPLATFLFSFLVLNSTSGIVSTSVRILMQSAPEDFDAAGLLKALKSIEGVEDVHHLHVWCIHSHDISLSLHVMVHSEAELNPVLKRVQEYLHSKGLTHNTIQMEVDTTDFCDSHENGACYKYD